jgi:S-adenosylmethionine uptake transporter
MSSSQSSSPEAPRPERRLFGVGLMVDSIGFYGLQDLFGKQLAMDGYAPAQILFFRALGTALVLLPLIGQVPRGGWITKQPWLMAFRCIIGATGMACYLIAFRTMSLVDVSAIGFTGPLIVVVLSTLLFGEQVGWRRWTAIVVGFIGVMVMLRPGLGVFSVAAAWALGGSIGFAGLTMSLRLLGRTDHPIAVTWTFTIASLIVLGVLQPWFWMAPDMRGYFYLLLQGAMCGAGQVLMTQALRVAPASTVTPFTYTIIIYGLVYGYFWFGDRPDPITLIGAVILIGSCLYIAHRERLHQAALTAPPGTAENSRPTL